MDRAKLEAASARYPYLRGLLFVPIGVWFLIAGVVFLWVPEMSWLTLFAGVLAVAAYLLIGRYYKANYGKETPPDKNVVRDVVATVAGVVLLIALSVLDSIFDLPISAYAAAFALVMLIYGAMVVGLETYHWVIWGGLLLAGIAPIWGAAGDSDVQASFLPIGVATIAAGLLDHRLLVRTYGSPAGLDLENSNAGA
jgi:hypothetical protein